MAWVSVAGESQSWTTQAGSAHTWSAQSNPASPLRLARVYAQESPQEDLPVIYRVQGHSPFLIATGSGIQIRSSITEAL